MKRMITAGLLSLGLLLGACSHYSEDLSSLDKNFKAPTTMASTQISPQDIMPAAGGTSATLNTYLAHEYYDLARTENDQAFDYKAAKEYTKKAMLASKGVVTPPSRISSYDIPANKIPELAQARKDLIMALKQNAPENQEQLAKAQTGFDCWLERSEEAADESHYAQCKNQFEQAMAMMVMPAAGEGTTAFEVIFTGNSAVIPPDSSKMIEYIALFLSKPENAGYTAAVTGDPADVLATSKVNAVRLALLDKGIADARLNGLTQPSTEEATAGSVKVALMPPAGGAPGSVTTKTFVPITPVTVPSTTQKK